jgi:hypothetical protein
MQLDQVAINGLEIGRWFFAGFSGMREAETPNPKRPSSREAPITKNIQSFPLSAAVTQTVAPLKLMPQMLSPRRNSSARFLEFEVWSFSGAWTLGAWNLHQLFHGKQREVQRIGNG